MSTRSSLSIIVGGAIFLFLCIVFITPAFGKTTSFASTLPTATPNGTLPTATPNGTLPTATPNGTLPTATPNGTLPTATPDSPTATPDSPTATPGSLTATPDSPQPTTTPSSPQPTATPVTTIGGTTGGSPQIVVVIPNVPGGRHVVDAASGTVNVLLPNGRPQFRIGYGIVAQTIDEYASERGSLEGVFAFYLSGWRAGGYHFHYGFKMSRVSPYTNNLWRQRGLAAHNRSARMPANNGSAEQQLAFATESTFTDTFDDVQVLCLNDRGQWTGTSTHLKRMDIQPVVDPASGKVVDYDVQLETNITQHGICGLFVRNTAAADVDVQEREETDLEQTNGTVESEQRQLEAGGVDFIEPDTPTEE